MNSSNSLNANIDALFNKMESFISTKTVVGEPFTFGDVIILPLVDLSFGMGLGVADNIEEKEKKERSGGGMGASITPSAVLVIKGKDVQLVNIKSQDSLNKIIDMAPGLINKLKETFFNKSNTTQSTINPEQTTTD